MDLCLTFHVPRQVTGAGFLRKRVTTFLTWAFSGRLPCSLFRHRLSGLHSGYSLLLADSNGVMRMKPSGLIAGTTLHADTTHFVWLELTGRCQLTCLHCYADSGPAQGHGVMTGQDWLRVIDQAAGHGVTRVCLIGGEPTAHPAFAELLDRALSAGMHVEVFTNLYRVTDRLWSLFSRSGVSLATSYYSADPDEHDAITGRPGSHRRTRASIAEAVRRRIPIRAGVIGLTSGQRTGQARADLIALGLPEPAIAFDRLRAFGRGAASLPDEADTCGSCGHGNAAILPDGTVTPCVFTRAATAGSVLTAPLSDVLTGTRFAAQVARLDSLRPASWPCVPNMCDPQCGPSCSPACRPAGNCRPVGACAPNYR
jgi:MoaA/NifB/PqqE/SkfB family radical SAM enzyme